MSAASAQPGGNSSVQLFRKDQSNIRLTGIAHKREVIAMNKIAVCVFALFALWCLPLAAAAQSQSPANGSREILTNASIINLSKARFREKTIISLIRTSQTAFDLSTTKLIELKKNGVNEKIITEMIERQAIFAGNDASRLLSLRDDDFFRADDNEFFRSASPRLSVPGNNRARQSATETQNDTQIFGSDSTALGQREARRFGGNGETAVQSELDGSATVRIVRPPAESGEPRLERAARLDNKAVIEMIQAGFSEGTVLRKIEITEVNFDLSGKAVAELRKNRVTERIIRAMNEAMNEERK
jgi:hypothetical protein